MSCSVNYHLINFNSTKSSKHKCCVVDEPSGELPPQNMSCQQENQTNQGTPQSNNLASEKKVPSSWQNIMTGGVNATSIITDGKSEINVESFVSDKRPHQDWVSLRINCKRYMPRYTYAYHACM